MRNCIRIPRLFVPKDNVESWAVVGCDRFRNHRLYWERVARNACDAPSVYSCILPDALLGEEDEERAEVLRESCYSVLEEGVLTRLERGCVLVERETGAGIRRGILAAIDLEEYSPDGGKDFLIRASTATTAALVENRLRARRGALLEFPHTVLCYRDKKDKLLRSVMGERLETIYRCKLSEGGGELTGYFLPDYLAEDIARELISRADPCFGVLDGNHTLAAAKAYWEEVKGKLSAVEQRNHPARFALAEFVNLSDDAVAFEPMHRLVKGVETEAFCDYFEKTVKCKRQGGVLYPILPAGTEGFAQVEAAIARYVRADGGSVEYFTGRPADYANREEDSVVIALPPVDKEELISVLKAGKRFPAKTFSLGREQDGRYCLEGREISYD